MIDEDYLKQKLAWATYRLDQLDKVEAKLVEMRKLAEYARDNTLSSEEIKKLNIKLQQLQQAVIAMDDRSKTFWLDNQ